MSASLVGSEMCIRDSHQFDHHRSRKAPPAGGDLQRAEVMRRLRPRAVSYTHLTLPTICSV
eukprot:7836327-Alexandrium_andersonii.AAC.1